MCAFSPFRPAACNFPYLCALTVPDDAKPKEPQAYGCSKCRYAELGCTNCRKAIDSGQAAPPDPETIAKSGRGRRKASRGVADAVAAATAKEPRAKRARKISSAAKEAAMTAAAVDALSDNETTTEPLEPRAKRGRPAAGASSSSAPPETPTTMPPPPQASGEQSTARCRAKPGEAAAKLTKEERKQARAAAKASFTPGEKAENKSKCHRQLSSSNKNRSTNTTSNK